MTKILIRGTKSPFEAVSAERMLRDNLIANNSGNLLFLETAWKILSTKGTEITADRLSAHRLGADRINERFDAYVIPLANAFRRSYMDSLIRLTRVIERLTIPVTVLGVGVQFARSHEPGAVRPFDDAVKAFARAVLDRSPSIGVRGETTQAYLRELGFRDVEVIGCPSMFLHGERMEVTKSMPTLDRDARIGMGITPTVPAMGPIVMSNVARYPNLEYLAQDIDALRLLLWGESSAAIGRRQRAADPPVAPTACVTTSRSSSWIRGHGSTTCARRTSCSGHASTAASRPCCPGRPAICSPTMRARWSSLATSTSRIARWRTHRPTSTPPTSTRRRISGR